MCQSATGFLNTIKNKFHQTASRQSMCILASGLIGVSWFDPQPSTRSNQLLTPSNVDPIIIYPCLLVWGVPVFLGDLDHFWRPPPHINKQGLINTGSTLSNTVTRTTLVTCTSRLLNSSRFLGLIDQTFNQIQPASDSFYQVLSKEPPYCGWTKSCTTLKPWLTP